MKKLTENFFRQDPTHVAKELLGKKLVRVVGGKRLEGIIAMASAYKGEAERKLKGLYYAPGQLYLPTFMGGYRKLAIATENQKKASVITIDKVLLEHELLTSGKICPYFKLDKEWDGKHACGGELWIEGGKSNYTIEKLEDVDMSSNCIGRYGLRI